MTTLYALTAQNPVQGFIVEEVSENYREMIGAKTIESEKYPEYGYRVKKVEVLQTDCTIADFCEDETTVTVNIQLNIDGEFHDINIHVQTHNQQYDTQGGCWIFGIDGEDLEFNESEQIAYDCTDIIDLAENYIQQ